MPRSAAVMQRWSAESIAFLRDASAYCNYHERLADAVLPFLPRSGSICDAGCGLGGLSRALAPVCGRITAIDRSEAAIRAMKQQPLPPNVTALCADIFTVRERFDAMVFCYFGLPSEILRLAAAHCDGTVVVLRRNCAEHRFSLGSVPLEHREGGLPALLTERGIRFHSEALSLEFGQPLRSMQAALDFFRLYNRSAQDVTEESVAPRLIRTGDPVFPFYSPMRRDMELTVFQAKELTGS